MSRHSNGNCSADLGNSRNRAIDRKPSREAKQHERSTNGNHGPRRGQGTQHVRYRRVAGDLGREEAEQEAEANNGEISEGTKTALATYAEAFGYKVDRIANYLKAQKAEAELAQREAERFQARHKAAENREKRLKQMLVWFMISRHTQKLRGSMNTISLQANSAASLTIQERSE